ncbi:hypothetical protein ABZ595_19210 [Streptomyces rubradiris]|uniref:hypothetical protein n=1 Tax=Streptomyces rubradiris TaxID=285531 RepID=UPI0033DE9FDA
MAEGDGALADSVLELDGHSSEHPAGLLHRVDAGLLIQETAALPADTGRPRARPRGSRHDNRVRPRAGAQPARTTHRLGPDPQRVGGKAGPLVRAGGLQTPESITATGHNWHHGRLAGRLGTPQRLPPAGAPDGPDEVDDVATHQTQAPEPPHTIDAPGLLAEHLKTTETAEVSTCHKGTPARRRPSTPGSEPWRTTLLMAVVRQSEALAVDNALELSAVLMANRLTSPARRAS